MQQAAVTGCPQVMRPWLLVTALLGALAACDSGERAAAKENGHAAAIARELERMRHLEADVCRCATLDCLRTAYEALQSWWTGIEGRVGPPAFDGVELEHAQAIGRSADVCFQRIVTQSFLRAAESHRQAMCKHEAELDDIIEEMRAYADALERLPGEQWPKPVGDEHERAYASLNHFAWCAEAIATGVQSRLPRVFQTWLEPTIEKPTPTIIKGG